jgi:hypothetical protein
MNRSRIFNGEKFLKNALTVVTAYYDIGRTERPTRTYLSWMRETLSLNSQFIIFTQEAFKLQVYDLLPVDRPCMVVILELDELPYYKHIDVMKKILNSKNYQLKMTAPDRIECLNPRYNIVQYSKFTFLEVSARLNPFKSKNFMWIDAGASRFFGKFKTNRPLLGHQINPTGFVMVMERRITRFFSHSSYEKIVWSSANYVRGTMMGGSRESIRRVAFEVDREWLIMIDNEAINNEQIALHLVYIRNKDLFSVFDFFSIANWERFLDFLAS